MTDSPRPANHPVRVISASRAGHSIERFADERFLTFGQQPSRTASLVGGRIPGAELAYFQDLYAERLEPREQTLQGCLISKLPMHNGLYRLYRGAEPVEVEQSLWRENAGYADLVVGRWHHGPQRVGIKVARFLPSCFTTVTAPFTADEFRSP